jgi:hypothetical protein
LERVFSLRCPVFASMSKGACLLARSSMYARPCFAVTSVASCCTHHCQAEDRFYMLTRVSMDTVFASRSKAQNNDEPEAIKGEVLYPEFQWHTIALER